MAEIVPEKSRTNIYALDRSFESVLSSFAPPVVGLLAQHIYGYKPIPTGSSVSKEVATDRENAGSLAKALYSAIGVPMSLCCLIYSFLYSTYPKDRERAQMEVLIEAEMLTIESQNLPENGQFSQVHLSPSEEPNFGNRTEIELDYETQDSLEDEDDENTLLYRQLTFANLSSE